MKWFVLLVALVGCAPGEYQHSEPEPQEYLSQSVVTAEQLSKVRDGMTVEEVSKIMGRDGETTAVNKGIEHVWNNKDGSFLSVLFVDGKVAERTSFQLK